MTDLTITLPTFGKDVLVFVPDAEGEELAELFNDASGFVHGLAAAGKIRDAEAGIAPHGATHEIVKQGDGAYRLRRFRFS